MKSIKSIVALIIILLSFAALCHAKDVPIYITSVKGDVEIKKAGTTDWVSADTKTILNTGDAIKTAGGSEAILAWSKENSLKVSELSVVNITSAMIDNKGLEKSEFNLEKGRLLAKAKKLKGGESFNVKTPSAVAGVRGTDFFGKIGDDNKTEFGAITGSLTVSAMGVEVIVDVSMQVGVEMGNPPSDIIEIPAEMLEELKQEADEVKQIIQSALPEVMKAGAPAVAAPEAAAPEAIDPFLYIPDPADINRDITIIESIEAFEAGMGGVKGTINLGY